MLLVIEGTFIVMEAVFQLREGKPPLIGVVFPQWHLAQDLNFGWVNNYHTHWYDILIYQKYVGIEITVSLNPFGFKHTYQITFFDSIALHNLIAKRHIGKQVNFAHLYRDTDGKLKGVKTPLCLRWWVLASKNVEIKYER